MLHAVAPSHSLHLPPSLCPLLCTGSDFSRHSQPLSITMPAAAPRKAAAKAAKKKASKFTIDCSKPVEDKIMDVSV